MILFRKRVFADAGLSAKRSPWIIWVDLNTIKGVLMKGREVHAIMEAERVMEPRKQWWPALGEEDPPLEPSGGPR